MDFLSKRHTFTVIAFIVAIIVSVFNLVLLLQEIFTYIQIKNASPSSSSDYLIANRYLIVAYVSLVGSLALLGLSIAGLVLSFNFNQELRDFFLALLPIVSFFTNVIGFLIQIILNKYFFSDSPTAAFDVAVAVLKTASMIILIVGVVLLRTSSDQEKGSLVIFIGLLLSMCIMIFSSVIILISGLNNVLVYLVLILDLFFCASSLVAFGSSEY